MSPFQIRLEMDSSRFILRKSLGNPPRFQTRSVRLRRPVVLTDSQETGLCAAMRSNESQRDATTTRLRRVNSFVAKLAARDLRINVRPFAIDLWKREVFGRPRCRCPSSRMCLQHDALLAARWPPLLGPYSSREDFCDQLPNICIGSRQRQVCEQTHH
jgi:hypothetical protein